SLIESLNSVECKSGYSASNRIQTNDCARLMIETLDVLLHVSLLLDDDIRNTSCQKIIQEAFLTWSDPANKRRIERTKLLIDVPDDYEPQKQISPNRKRRIQTTTNLFYPKNLQVHRKKQNRQP
ncbi:unnamed protein product, partial [Didymodactylos carnosus]